MSKWLRSNGDGTYTPEGIEANIGSTSDLPNPQKSVCENIKDLSEWKLLGSASAGSSVVAIGQLPNDWREVMMYFSDKTDNGYVKMTMKVIKEMIVDNVNYFRTGYYASSTENAEVVINITQSNYVSITEFFRKGAKVTNGNNICTIYYK